MLVDDKQAREKMAKEVDRYMGNLIPGFSERHDGAIVCLTRLAAAIRQTDLSDCKVEVADGTIASVVAWLRGHERGDVSSQERPTRGESANAIESLSAQVAELKKDAERMAGVISRGNCPECHGWMCHNSDCSVYALIKNFLSAAKESGVSP